MLLFIYLFQTALKLNSLYSIVFVYLLKMFCYKL